MFSGLCSTRVHQQGNFDEETVPVEIQSKRGPPTIISKDEEYTNVSRSMTRIYHHTEYLYTNARNAWQWWAYSPSRSPSDHHNHDDTTPLHTQLGCNFLFCFLEDRLKWHFRKASRQSSRSWEQQRAQLEAFEICRWNAHRSSILWIDVC